MLFNTLVAIFFLSAVLLWTSAVVGWYYIESPAVNWFGIVAAMAGTGAFALFGSLLLGNHVFVIFSAITIALFLPIPWLFFSFDYVGKDELVSPFVGVVISTPVAVGLFATGIIFSGRVFPWFSLPPQETASGVSAVLISILNLSQFFMLLYAGGLVLAGSGVILWMFERYRHLDSTTGIVLVTFGTVPWVSILFGLQLEGTSSTAFTAIMSLGFSVGAVAAVGLVGPYSLFDRVPAAGNIGPNTVIEELADLVLVTNGDGLVVEANLTARDTIEQELVGQSVEGTFETTLEELRTTAVLGVTTSDGRVLFEPTVSRLSDQHDHLLGYAIILRDVTSRITRQQRLDVQNRILRHNLRNNLSIVAGHSDVIQQRTDSSDVADSAEKIIDASNELVDISREARDTEKILTVDPDVDGLTMIKPLVEQVFESVASPAAADLSYDGPESVGAPIMKERLETLLRHLIENAIIHNDDPAPEVRVAVDYDPESTYPLSLSVLDNGPGIPDLEQQVIQSGRETALEHTSGIGLWVLRWITTSVGGDLSFSEREPTGSIVTVRLPTASRVDTEAT